MSDKDKLILVFYLNLSNLSREDWLPYIEHVKEAMNRFFDDTVKAIYMPIDDGETRVDCINPVLLDAEKYKEVQESVELFETEFKKALDEIGK